MAVNHFEISATEIICPGKDKKQTLRFPSIMIVIFLMRMYIFTKYALLHIVYMTFIHKKIDSKIRNTKQIVRNVLTIFINKFRVMFIYAVSKIK